MLRAICNSAFEATTPTVEEAGIFAVRADFIVSNAGPSSLQFAAPSHFLRWGQRTLQA